MAIIGIDLGTTNSLVSVYRKGKVEIIPNQFGELLTPSVVSITEEDTIVVGKIAKERLISNPETTFSSYKQFMGSEEVFKANKHKFKAEDLSSFVLKQLKEDAEKYMGEEVQEAIISVPAYFNDLQRVATRNAGLLAGLKVDRILNEPSAAALAYREKEDEDGLFIVFDFGGGTLDISLVEIFENIVDILAVSGDNHLGGDNIDEALLMAFLKENDLEKNRISKKDLAILKKRIEAAKIALSEQEEVKVEMIINKQTYQSSFDHHKVAICCAEILGKIRKTLERVLRDGNKHITNIDKIICVGGSTKSRIIQDYIQHLTNIEPEDSIHPDEAIAYGVGVAAGIKGRSEEIKDMILTDICPFSLGTGINDGSFSSIIPRNTSLPASRTNYYETVYNNQEEVNFVIYQGENMRAASNLKLDKVSIDVPPLPAGEAKIKATFTYDLNGLLDVEIESLNTGKKVGKLIVMNHQLNENEINERMAVLNRIKQENNDDVEKEYLEARAQSIYEEVPEFEKNLVLEKLRNFLREYNGLNLVAREKARREFSDFLDSYQAYDTGLKKDFYS